jgi:CubicO group peptidase (beta-lactamase class C family)
MRTIPYLLILLLVLNCTSDDVVIFPDQTYYPPNQLDVWETVSPDALGWNTGQLNPLLNYLEDKNTKAFIILYNGRIAVESYFNGQSREQPWYWASAGKTLTTFIVGIAENEDLINISQPVSNYIGTGWTSAPLGKENLISSRNLLTMTSGLDDSLGDGVEPADLQYLADAGTRWAYHNVYKKLQDVVSEASGEHWSSYFNSRLRDRIGMTGDWFQVGDFNVYWSNARSMARFGLLNYSKGRWKGNQIIPESFHEDAVTTSQTLNASYGYMWWLNGKSSFRLPQTQLEFDGPLIPHAPSDMYCALGRNDQKIYVVPSKKLVVVRMGDAADDTNFTLSDFDNELWLRINLLTN